MILGGHVATSWDDNSFVPGETAAYPAVPWGYSTACNAVTEVRRLCALLNDFPFFLFAGESMWSAVPVFHAAIQSPLAVHASILRCS